MSDNFTAEDLAALEAALAKGVRVVKYTDKEIQYRSVSEMLQIRDLIRSCLGLQTGRGIRRVGVVDKALG